MTTSGGARDVVRTGDDIVLTNIAAFDVRAYALRGQMDTSSGSIALQPGDFGWTNSGERTGVDTGVFVDLNPFNFSTSTTSDPADLEGSPSRPNGTDTTNTLYYLYSNSGLTAAQQTSFGFSNVYDTWSPHYEEGGLAKNGLDDDNANGVDDPGERIARPPYSTPMRGLKVTLRMVEDNTKQVRQSSVIQSFVPCLLYTSPSPRDLSTSRMPSSA